MSFPIDFDIYKIPGILNYINEKIDDSKAKKKLFDEDDEDRDSIRFGFYSNIEL